MICPGSSTNVKKLSTVKKILLASGDNSGLLRTLPLYRRLQASTSCEAVIAGATGPHEEDLSSLFEISDSFITIAVGQGSVVEKTALALTGFADIMVREKPDLVIVAGENDISLAAALSSSRLGLPYASLEAGMRSYNRNAPREANRRLIDAAADMMFVSEHSGTYNLISEGSDEERIFFVGNMLIDALALKIADSNSSSIIQELGYTSKQYALVRLECLPAVDTLEAIRKAERLVGVIAATHPVLLQLAPDVNALIEQHAMLSAFTSIDGVTVRPPAGYVDQLRLIKDAVFILTDTRDMQAEATVMKVPCLTMSSDTTSPASIEIGTNMLVGTEEDDILMRIQDALEGKLAKHAKIPEKWDGAAAQRVVEVLEKVLAG